MKYRIIVNCTWHHVNVVILDVELAEYIAVIIATGFEIESVTQTDANLS